MNDWPKGPTSWIEDRHLFVSVPFTWNLPDIRAAASQRSFFWDGVTVGGPAVKLSRRFKNPFRWPDGVTVDYGDIDGVLERVNPRAMRTSMGCVNSCGFCGVPIIEPKFYEWRIHTATPIICDNNFLACSETHRRCVYNCLNQHPFDVQIDFNQGLDARRLSGWDARWLKKLGAMCRLAYDTEAVGDDVRNAYGRLRAAGVIKKNISFYALVGWLDTPEQAWKRCLEIESWKVHCCPMWFHELDALEWNQVTEKQKALGWTNQKRLDIMGWFWQHRGTPPGIEITPKENHD